MRTEAGGISETAAPLTERHWHGLADVTHNVSSMVRSDAKRHVVVAGIGARLAFVVLCTSASASNFSMVMTSRISMPR